MYFQTLYKQTTHTIWAALWGAVGSFFSPLTSLWVNTSLIHHSQVLALYLSSYASCGFVKTLKRGNATTAGSLLLYTSYLFVFVFAASLSSLFATCCSNVSDHQTYFHIRHIKNALFKWWFYLLREKNSKPVWKHSCTLTKLYSSVSDKWITLGKLAHSSLLNCFRSSTLEAFQAWKVCLRSCQLDSSLDSNSNTFFFNEPLRGALADVSKHNAAAGTLWHQIDTLHSDGLAQWDEQVP